MLRIVLVSRIHIRIRMCTLILIRSRIRNAISIRSRIHRLSRINISIRSRNNSRMHTSSRGCNIVIFIVSIRDGMTRTTSNRGHIIIRILIRIRIIMRVRRRIPIIMRNTINHGVDISIIMRIITISFVLVLIVVFVVV